MSYRRSFLREFRSLCLCVEEEFHGQIKICDVYDMDLDTFSIDVIPEKGLYAHGSFRFDIKIPSTYPQEMPVISCRTLVFHPNIDYQAVAPNVCTNLTFQWSRNFGLEEVLRVILFLFYEPNFSDPLNHEASKIPDGMSLEQCIRQSLMGGIINGVEYPPNEAWCAWAKEHGVFENSVQTAGVSGEVQSSTSADGVHKAEFSHQDSVATGSFACLKGGHFSSDLDLVESDISRHYGQPFCFLYTHRIRLSRTVPNTEKEFPWDSCSVYYFGGCENFVDFFPFIPHPAICAWIDNVFYNKVNHSTQKVTVKNWPFSETYGLWQSYDSDVDSHGRREMDTSDTELSNEVNVPYNHDVLDGTSCSASAVDEMNTRNCKVNGDLTDTLPPETGGATSVLLSHATARGDDADLEIESQTMNVLNSFLENKNTTENNHQFTLSVVDDSKTDTGLRTEVEDGCHKRYRSKAEVILPSTMLTNRVIVDRLISYDCDENFKDFGQVRSQEQTEANDLSSVVTDSVDQDSLYELNNRDEREWSSFIQRGMLESKSLMRKLMPLWWPLYQTRWPPCFSSGQWIVLIPTQEDWCTYDFLRPSPVGLYNGLYQYSQKNSHVDSLILVDVLALSPFSPIFNRMISIHLSHTFENVDFSYYIWRSVEWMSLAEALSYRSVWRSGGGGSMINQSSFVLAGLCLISNWIGYLSRMELYSHPLGYTRRATTLLLDSMGVSCLTAASLGCGQCPVFDAWPFWLAYRTSRILCHATCFLSRFRFPYCKHSAHLLFPFNDVDEI
ncbi:unnamed protein product [Calicophoron daubneyi]|uniref:UBC core domain-containing protein n=1 Tax=Calicophoron daubneyi TaxID=300641 RepID=A0AAV2TF22_CALDB